MINRGITQSYALQRAFTFGDMRRHAAEAWGLLGADIADTWRKFNAAYFDGALRPIPLIVSQMLPFGRRIGQCSYNLRSWQGRAITLNLPDAGGHLIADNNTLLHEMLHQYLFERGEDPAHMAEPWRREIMRLTKLITGKTIWAGPSKVIRQNGKATRINAPHPKTKEPSLPQAVIARWPHNELAASISASLANPSNGELNWIELPIGRLPELELRVPIAPIGIANCRITDEHF